MDSGPDPFLKKPEVRRQTPEEVLLISGFRVLASEGGFPHSEILGSKLVRSSPRLIAAYHVLHRLSAPRHPPNALKALDRSHDRCPPVPQDGGPIRPLQSKERTIRKTCLRLSPKTFACLTHPVVQRSDDQRSEIESPRWCAGSLRQPNASPLHNVKHPPASPKEPPANFLKDFDHHTHQRSAAGRRPADHLVEPDGIEPTTSCLQSTRSPN
jgi:hypothetical protein